MTKNKLVIIPTIVLSAALLLTGCTSGNNGGGNGGSPNPTSTASTPAADDTSTQPIEGYVAPPEKMGADYKGFYMAPMTINEEAWAYYKGIGATTYKEDPAVRSTTKSDWESAREDKANFGKFDKMYGEVTSDIEQTALKVSAHLEKNANANVDDLNNNKDLLVNRYPNIGKTTVEKDAETGFYFSVFRTEDGGVAYGILVPQKGITPDFEAPTASQ